MFDRSESAKALSRLGSSKGGKARADALTSEERSDIARHAAELRWERQGRPVLRQATHEGEIPIGELRIPCAVLEDGTRLLSETGVVNALGLYRSGAVHVRSRDAAGPQLPLFVANKNIKPFVDAELEAILLSPIWFKTRDGSTRNKGVPATVLPKICNVWLQARDAGVLSGKRQELVALRADILMRGFAETGIIALVDEATGFQDDRARDALAKILEAFVAKELQRWIRTFPSEYYKELFRLKNIPYTGELTGKRPQYVGTLTNNIVYSRLAPGVLTELRRKNPPDERGRRKHKHFQHLTPDMGHPKLLQHLGGVITLMRLAKSWDEFKNLLDRTHPKYLPMPLFENDESQNGD